MDEDIDEVLCFLAENSIREYAQVRYLSGLLDSLVAKDCCRLKETVCAYSTSSLDSSPLSPCALAALDHLTMEHHRRLLVLPLGKEKKFRFVPVSDHYRGQLQKRRGTFFSLDPHDLDTAKAELAKAWGDESAFADILHIYGAPRLNVLDKHLARMYGVKVHTLCFTMRELVTQDPLYTLPLRESMPQGLTLDIVFRWLTAQSAKATNRLRLVRA